MNLIIIQIVVLIIGVYVVFRKGRGIKKTKDIDKKLDEVVTLVNISLVFVILSIIISQIVVPYIHYFIHKA
ncbi:hypothetical protein [Lagierella massiliensis]|uniref:hypothetical protein n=1 Tax=Lagierella massiliensis TaxID=1689303 RepID=UPI0006D82461|nr:hypothetical protein [Lagierella massiliensis]